jgi:hypothetical protein
MPSKYYIIVAAVAATGMGAFLVLSDLKADSSNSIGPEESQSSMRNIPAIAQGTFEAATAAPAPRLESSLRAADFQGETFALLGSGMASIFDVFKAGVRSGIQEREYLAYLAYDACLSYVHPTSTPLEKPFPDGDSMRRAQAIKAQMKIRCEGFVTLRTEDLLRMGRELHERMISDEMVFSTNYAGMPRSPTDDDVKRAGDRLSDVLTRYGPVALLSNSGNLVHWLSEAGRNLPDVKMESSLREEPGTLTDAVNVAICFAGFDCSASSTLYGISCGAHHDCASSMEESILATAGDKRARTLFQAKVIADAFVRRDPTPLGLPVR